MSNTKRKRGGGENNTWLSSNFGASQNNDIITNNSSTIDESTAASAILVKTYKQPTNVAHKKVETKTNKHVATNRSVLNSQNRFAFTKIKDIVDVYNCFELPKTA